MNLAALLEGFLKNQTAQSVTNIILALLLVIFLWAMLQAKRGKWKDFVHYTPNLLISLGIFGTFVGIVIGLIGFEIDDIDGSIGLLLGGLKTAFMTSLAGMLLAIIFKSIDSAGMLRPREEDEDEPYTATPEDILASLRQQEAALDRLATSIAGNEESTLITQIRLLRSDSQDANRHRTEVFAAFEEKLWKQMTEFADTLSKSATETVIDALRNVIVDFNRNLTEQFGDNFKHLNEAVEKLVNWQESYREQLGQMIEQYALGVTAISKTEESVAIIGHETRQIPVAMEWLKKVLDTTQHQLNELERHLEAFRDMRDRAVEAVPQIQQNIDKIVREVAEATADAGRKLVEASASVNQAILTGAQDFQDQVHRANASLTSASDHLANNSSAIREQLEASVSDINSRVRDMIETLASSNAELQKNIQTTQNQVAKSIESMQKRLQSSMEEVLQTQATETNRAFQGLQDEIRKTVARTGEGITAQLEVLDKAMQAELERVISSLGSNLAAVTKKFADDYGGLTRQMQAVVQQANRSDLRQ